MAFKVARLLFIDSLISVLDKNTPYKVILNLKGLEKQSKYSKIFISIRKDYNDNFILYYKNKYYQDASIIANYLAVVMLK